MSQLQERIKFIKNEIRETAKSIGKEEKDIKLLLATKSQPLERIEEAYHCGQTLFGENYVQEFLKKWEVMKNWKSLPSVDFIGHLQTNKVKFIIDKVTTIQTVDSLKLLHKISETAEKRKLRIPLFIEVNIGEEKTQDGILPTNLLAFFKELPQSSSVEIRGLMTIPPYEEDPEKSRPYFKKMKALFDELNSLFPDMHFSELSMGMSCNFKIAIQEGATQIRIGEAIFGPRT